MLDKFGFFLYTVVCVCKNRFKTHINEGGGHSAENVSTQQKKEK